MAFYLPFTGFYQVRMDFIGFFCFLWDDFVCMSIAMGHNVYFHWIRQNVTGFSVLLLGNGGFSFVFF